MATAQRIYLVTISQAEHLVRASTAGQALQHVARSIATVQVANQDTLVTCIEAGVKVETAGAPEDDAS